MATESAPTPDRSYPAQRPRPHHVSAGRIVAIVGGAILTLVALALVALLVLTNTDWGREQVRRRVVTILNHTAHGRIAIDHIAGNLLKGLSLNGVVITDSGGAPFLKLDSARVGYGLRSLVSKRIEL